MAQYTNRNGFPPTDDSRALQGSIDDGRAIQMTAGPYS